MPKIQRKPRLKVKLVESGKTRIFVDPYYQDRVDEALDYLLAEIKNYPRFETAALEAKFWLDDSPDLENVEQLLSWSEMVTKQVAELEYRIALAEVGK